MEEYDFMAYIYEENCGRGLEVEEKDALGSEIS